MFVRHIFVFSAALVERLAELSPWKSMNDASQPTTSPDQYAAWHIRTVDPGERARDYDPNVHIYMITEPAPVVCSAFEEVTAGFLASCPSLFPGGLDVFLSANRSAVCML